MGKIEHLFEKITDKAEDFGEKTSEKAEEILEKVAEKTEKIGEEKKTLPQKVIIFAVMLIVILFMGWRLSSVKVQRVKDDAAWSDKYDKAQAEWQERNRELTTTIDNLNVTINDLNSTIDQLRQELEEAKKITVDSVKMRLETMGELVTARNNIDGFIHFKEGSIPLLAQKSFIMYYEAEITASFNLEALSQSIVVTEDAVEITLPPVTYSRVHVYSDSIQFFDKQFSIFKREELQDAIDCIAMAEEDAKYQYDKNEFEKTAIKQAKTIISALLNGTIGGRKLIIHDPK